MLRQIGNETQQIRPQYAESQIGHHSGTQRRFSGSPNRKILELWGGIWGQLELRMGISCDEPVFQGVHLMPEFRFMVWETSLAGSN